MLYASRMEVHLDMTLDELIAALARFFFFLASTVSHALFSGGAGLATRRLANTPKLPKRPGRKRAGMRAWIPVCSFFLGERGLPPADWQRCQRGKTAGPEEGWNEGLGFPFAHRPRPVSTNQQVFSRSPQITFQHALASVCP